MRELLNNPHPAGVGILRGRAVTWGRRECRMHALYLQIGLEWVRMADRTIESVNTWTGGWVSYKSWKREAALDGGQRKQGSIMSSRAMQGQPRDRETSEGWCLGLARRSGSPQHHCRLKVRMSLEYTQADSLGPGPSGAGWLQGPFYGKSAFYSLK